MNFNRLALLVMAMLLSHTSFSQKTQGFYMADNLMLSYHNLGSYSDQGNIYYLEHEFNYRLQKLSFSLGIGFNLYPAAYTIPVGLKAYYHFKVGKHEAYVAQSYAYNLKIGRFSFASNRYMGSVGFSYFVNPSKRIGIDTGYSLIWDQYGGGNLGFTIGLFFKYKFAG